MHDQHLLRRAACRSRRPAAGWRRASRRSRRACSRRRRRRPACAGSVAGAATDASASGKLAPQRMAPGSTANSAAHQIELELEPGLGASDGLIGQYGSESVRMYAVHAIAAHSASWHQPSATRGRAQAARQRRADAAADAEPGEEHGEDQRERVDRRAEEQRQRAASRSPRTPSAVRPDSAMAT